MNVTTQFKPKVSSRPSVAYVIDPRFPGGTSSAVAQELQVVSQLVTPQIYGLSSRMFSGDDVAPQLKAVLGELGLCIQWDPAKITADVVIIHNPSFLKFQSDLQVQILADRLFVVTHENFTRPGGALSFDVANCLDLIDKSALAMRKILAPISAYNRSTVAGWLDQAEGGADWQVLRDDWFNICDFKMAEPTAQPQDRRGRISRPGFEKFPSLKDMELCFPKSAQSNIILGADHLLELAGEYPHWQLFPFRGLEVAQFFEMIDFVVYFSSPKLRESFGRILAEGIAAGKVVISDAGNAANFGHAVIAARPDEVSRLISNYIADPRSYTKQVKMAHKSLNMFSKNAFVEFFQDQVLNLGVYDDLD